MVILYTLCDMPPSVGIYLGWSQLRHVRLFCKTKLRKPSSLGSVPVSPSVPVYWPVSSYQVYWCISASGRFSPGPSVAGLRIPPAATCPSGAFLGGPVARKTFPGQEPLRRRRLKGWSTWQRDEQHNFLVNSVGGEDIMWNISAALVTSYIC